MRPRIEKKSSGCRPMMFSGTPKSSVSFMSTVPSRQSTCPLALQQSACDRFSRGPHPSPTSASARRHSPEQPERSGSPAGPGGVHLGEFAYVKPPTNDAPINHAFGEKPYSAAGSNGRIRTSARPRLACVWRPSRRRPASSIGMSIGVTMRARTRTGARGARSGPAVRGGRAASRSGRSRRRGVERHR
jgi:hypothetical protein